MRVLSKGPLVSYAVLVCASVCMGVVDVPALRIAVRDIPLEKTQSINATMGYIMGIIGVDVVKVSDGTPASRAGLRKNMIVSSVKRESGGRTILHITPTNAEYFSRISDGFTLGETVTFSVWEQSEGNALLPHLPGQEQPGKWYQKELRFIYLPSSENGTPDSTTRQRAFESLLQNAPLAQAILLRTLEKSTSDRNQLIVNLAAATLTGGGSMVPIILEHSLDAGLEVLVEESIMPEDKVQLLRGALTLIRAVNGLSNAEDVIAALRAVQQAYGGLIDLGVVDDATDKNIRVRLSVGAESLNFILALDDVAQGHLPKPDTFGVQLNPTVGNLLGMQFVEVKSGSFQMGTPSGGNDNERPVRTVRIMRDFRMGKYEVTQREYQQLMGNNPSRFKGNDLPVEMVSWNDAVKFCEELTRRERAAGRLPAGLVYRLPTEAEWEYASRGGHLARNTQYAGSDNLDTVAWHSGNSQNRTQRVGTKVPNELGLHDMSGNVWEWVHDWYQNSYNGLATTDPGGPRTGSSRVYRGGCWRNAASICRVAFRSDSTPTISDFGLGFRVVVAAPVQ